MTTAELFDLTDETLLAYDWERAEILLDELATRGDCHYPLASPAVYGAPECVAVRIRRVNARAWKLILQQ